MFYFSCTLIYRYTTSPKCFSFDPFSKQATPTAYATSSPSAYIRPKQWKVPSQAHITSNTSDIGPPGPTGYYCQHRRQPLKDATATPVSEGPERWHYSAGKTGDADPMTTMLRVGDAYTGTGYDRARIYALEENMNTEASACARSGESSTPTAQSSRPDGHQPRAEAKIVPAASSHFSFFLTLTLTTLSCVYCPRRALACCIYYLRVLLCV